MKSLDRAPTIFFFGAVTEQTSMPRTSKFVLYSLRVFAVALIVSPMIFWKRGIVDSEATLFIPQYLDSRTLLQKVFDPHKNDFDTFQARELSFFFDYLDAHWFKLLWDHGFLLFISASSLIASIAILVVHQVSSARMLPAVNRITSLLVLLLFFSNYIPFVTAAVYYRSSKPVLVPLLFFAAMTIWYLHKKSQLNPVEQKWRTTILVFCVTFVLGSSMALLDRQGFFYLVVAAVVLAIHWLVRRGRLDIVLGMSSALVFSLYYNRVLGPTIVHSINGYWPDPGYQRIVRQILWHPQNLRKGLIMVLEPVWILYGSLPRWVFLGAAMVAVGYFVVSWMNSKHISVRERLKESISIARKRMSALSVFYGALVFIALVIMNAIMAIRYPPVYDYVDHRLWYYAVPAQVLFVFGTLLFLNWFYQHGGSKYGLAVNIVLLAMVVHNIMCWGNYKERMLQSNWFPTEYYQSGYLKESLGNGKAHPLLAKSHLVLFEYCVFDKWNTPVQWVPDVGVVAPR